ncbi:cysteine proteinase [Trametopsis cervina]|nr:cysteine proteinase [Trametopsis cervina]
MANPHQHYTHPGPTYYHSPPPPYHYPYNPGPVPYYPYPINSLNGHSPPPHQPASPRMNASGRGGYHPHRAGGPSFQHSPHVPHQHYLQPQPALPHLPPTTYAQPPQKYSPHLQHVAYSQPFRPSLNGQYHSNSWSTQTLSPLPKQLSMPAQLPSPLPPAEDSPAPPPHLDPLPETVPPSELDAHVSSTQQPAPPLLPNSPPAPTSLIPSKARVETPPIETEGDDGPRSLMSPNSEATTSSVVVGSAGSLYVVWSRKPRNPSLAVGVMISSRALPPPHIIDGATDIRTPPASPKIAVSSDPVPFVSTILAETVPSKHPSQSSPSSAEIPSSSVTETTTNSTAPVTPTAGSPSSANTSVTSAAPSPLQQIKPLNSVSVEGKLPSGDSVSSEQAQKIESSQDDRVEEVPVTQAQPVLPKPPVNTQKKSWASLLQSNDATASSSKSRLPTSAVVGFSIPAGLQGGTSSSAKTSSGTVRPEVLNLLNSGPSGTSVAPKIRPRGLINTGNMCFANAVLQVLVYCPPFWRLFTELGKYISGPALSSTSSTATPLVDAIIQFLKEFGIKEPEDSKPSRSKGKEREEDFDDIDSFIPTYVYDVMKEKKRFASMVGGHQEDAEEFLGFFLDTLEEELLSLSSSNHSKQAEEGVDQGGDGWLEVGKRNRAANTRGGKGAESPITRIFGGKFRSILKAPHQRDSIAVEEWRSLRLDIQREQVTSIKDALQQLSHPHPVEISSATRPGVVIEATRQELIESLPPILVLHLKRFLYDTKVGDVVKIGKHVSFGPLLEIAPDLIAQRPPQPVKYQLIGALYHHGQSASGGHYTLDVLHPNRDLNDRPRQAWIRIDDELVSDVRPEDVFGGQERDDRCAYLLFYRRVGAGVPSKP